MLYVTRDCKCVNAMKNASLVFKNTGLNQSHKALYFLQIARILPVFSLVGNKSKRSQMAIFTL